MCLTSVGIRNQPSWRKVANNLLYQMDIIALHLINVLRNQLLRFEKLNKYINTIKLLKYYNELTFLMVVL